MTVVEHPRTVPLVDPAAASVRQAEFVSVPLVSVAAADGARTLLVVRFAGMELELYLDPSDVDALAGALMDVAPVPYEWPVTAWDEVPS